MSAEEASPYAIPRIVERLDDCDFYHVMNLPGGIETDGQWDLRHGLHDYLGGFDFAGKRVLEIGPASGFLTFSIEKMGGEIVAIELTHDHVWDFVPYADHERVQQARLDHKVHMERINNAFWYCHRAFKSKAKLCYANPYQLPEIGKFDAALIASVLIHSQNPVGIISECARRADTLIIVDHFEPTLEGEPVCKLYPTPETFHWDAWWLFSTQFFRQYLSVLGFGNQTLTVHTQLWKGKPSGEIFTLVATRSAPEKQSLHGRP